jgi:integrase
MSQNGSQTFNSEQAGTYKSSNADYPLRWHPRGGWCKKIRGRVYYWGRVTPEVALDRYVHERDYLQRGEQPPAYDQNATTIKELCNEFLSAKQSLLTTGELAQRTWDDYERSCGYMIKHLGRNRAVADLRPIDFVEFRTRLSKGRGIVALANEINRARVVFKFAYDSDLVSAPVKYGSTFKRPSKGKMRSAKHAAGRQDFEPEEVVKILDATTGQLHAMVLLGVNCGLGNADISRLDASSLDLDAGWLTYPRPKTGALRRSPLWEETVKALRPFVSSGRVFTTRHHNPWTSSSLTHEIRKVLDAIGMLKDQRNFYGLRRSFRTIADECRDPGACNVIMGHTDDKTMGDVYNQRIADERLLLVSNHVRTRIFPAQAS